MSGRNPTGMRHAKTNSRQRLENGAAEVVHPTLKSIMQIVKQNDMKQRINRASSEFVSAG